MKRSQVHGKMNFHEVSSHTSPAAPGYKIKSTRYEHGRAPPVASSGHAPPAPWGSDFPCYAHRGSVLLLSLPNSYLSTYFQFFEFAAPIFSPATGEPPLLHILSLILSGPHLFDLWFCILLAILLKYVVHRSFNWHYRDD